MNSLLCYLSYERRMQRSEGWKVGNETMCQIPSCPGTIILRGEQESFFVCDMLAYGLRWMNFHRHMESLGWTPPTFIMFAILTLVFTITTFARIRSGAIVDYSILVPSVKPPSEIQYLWGPYSPWHPAEKYTPPPEGCTINQVCRFRLSLLEDHR
jgi:hypothetical protein